MKKHIYLFKAIFLFMSIILLTGCEIAGLELQEDEPYDYNVLDPEIDMTASEFLYLSRQDTLFLLMQRGIEYAGLAEEYARPERTFLFLTNDAILRYNPDGSVNEDCYFGYHKVDGEAADQWEDYTREEVRDFFLYHIIEGMYSYDNLTPENTEVTTMLEHENNKAYMKIMNARNSKLRVNDTPFTLRYIEARTSNIQSTNGIIHVFNGFIEPIP